MWSAVRPASASLDPYVAPGPVLADALASAEESRERGGSFATWRRVLAELRAEDVVELIEAAGLRGRGGGGFPTALKWAQVARSRAEQRYLICNLHGGQPGGLKERFLLRRCPCCIVEAAAIAAHAIQATSVVFYLGRCYEEEERLLSRVIEQAAQAGLTGPGAPGPSFAVRRSPGGYVTGEETAIMELLEGRSAQPRGKPPLPTRNGVRGQPTTVSNLETLLQARYVVKHGPERFRAVGTRYCPGTVIVSLIGDVERPGVYEVAMGTSLRELIFDVGGGTGSRSIQAVLPGGVSSRVLGPESLELRLDFDALRDADVDLGSGVVVVFAEERSMPEVALHLARFYRDQSCGKCQPCADGTRRVARMLEHLDELEQKSVDLADRPRPPSARKGSGLVVLGNRGAGRDPEPGGVSYTDTTRGLDKVHLLSEWFKHRGDCHFATEAARNVQSFLERFGPQFEQRMSTAAGGEA